MADAMPDAADADGNASDQTAHRLRPEERMLLFIMYVRSLQIGDIVDYIISKPLLDRRGKVKEYDHLPALHAELISKLAEGDSKYTVFTNSAKGSNTLFYHPPKIRLNSKRWRLQHDNAEALPMKKRGRKNLSTLAKKCATPASPGYL